MGHVKDRWYSGKGDARKPSSRHGRGKRWQVWYTIDGREKCGGSFDNKVVAQRKLVELEGSVLRGLWIDPTDRTTVVEYARRWAAARPYRSTTARRVTQQIENHIAGTALGGRRLAAVLPSDVQSWVNERSRALSPSTVAGLVNLLRSIYGSAVLDRLAATSPVARIALPRAEGERVVPLTVQQVRDLADAVPPRNRAMVLVQAGLGLRIGELLALRVQDVDFLRRTVRVEHQLHETSRERVATKTPRSRRSIPLPQMVAEALAVHIAEHPPLADGSLFYGHNKRPYRHHVYSTHVFKRAVRKLAAAEDSTFPESTSTHDMRHHYASVLLAAGESVVAVAERLGHENATMVLKVYGHLLPDSEDRTRKAIDAAWDPAPEESAGSVTAPGRPR